MDEVDLVHSHDEEVGLLLVVAHAANLVHRANDEEDDIGAGLVDKVDLLHGLDGNVDLLPGAR